MTTQFLGAVLLPYLAIAAAALLLGKYGGRARGLVARWVFALMLFAGIAKQIVAPRLLHPLAGTASPRRRHSALSHSLLFAARLIGVRIFVCLQKAVTYASFSCKKRTLRKVELLF